MKEKITSSESWKGKKGRKEKVALINNNKNFLFYQLCKKKKISDERPSFLCRESASLNHVATDDDMKHE